MPLRCARLILPATTHQPDSDSRVTLTCRVNSTRRPEAGGQVQLFRQAPGQLHYSALSRFCNCSAGWHRTLSKTMHCSIMNNKLKPALSEKFNTLEFLKSGMLLEHICTIAHHHTRSASPYPWVRVCELSHPSAKQQDGAKFII